MALNKLFVQGRLAKDPETKQTKNGMSVTTFTLANDKRSSEKNPEPGANFFDCVAWGKRGEAIAKFFKKGSPILVEGRLDHQTWEQDGMKRSRVLIIVDDFQFLGEKKDALPTDKEVNEGINDGIPF